MKQRSIMFFETLFACHWENQNRGYQDRRETWIDCIAGELDLAVLRAPVNGGESCKSGRFRYKEIPVKINI